MLGHVKYHITLHSVITFSNICVILKLFYNKNMYLEILKSIDILVSIEKFRANPFQNMLQTNKWILRIN